MKALVDALDRIESRYTGSRGVAAAAKEMAKDAREALAAWRASSLADDEALVHFVVSDMIKRNEALGLEEDPEDRACFGEQLKDDLRAVDAYLRSGGKQYVSGSERPWMKQRAELLDLLAYHHGLMCTDCDRDKYMQRELTCPTAAILKANGK